MSVFPSKRSDGAYARQRLTPAYRQRIWKEARSVSDNNDGANVGSAWNALVLYTLCSYDERALEYDWHREEMMHTNMKQWLPMALCCLPGVAIVAIIGIGVAAGEAVLGSSFGGPLGLGLIALAMLACPLSMGLMMRRGTHQNTASGQTTMVACCTPGEQIILNEPEAADRLAVLRAQREQLEREVAELQARQLVLPDRT